MKTLWKGAINFGLVNIPVKMYTATSDKDINFRHLHAKCQAPLSYEKRCSKCGQEVPQEELALGYEYEKDRFVILKEEDFQRIPGESSKTIDILDFVNLSEIDPIYFEKSYYLEPSLSGEKAYALLKKAMSDTGKIAIAKVAIRSKSSLACLRVYGNVVMMETMRFPDEIRSPQGLTGINIEATNEKEIALAINLIENLSEPFNPSKYTNTYREQLMEIIQAKITGNEVITTVVPEKGKVVDIMDALKASLEATTKPKTKKSKSLA